MAIQTYSIQILAGVAPSTHLGAGAFYRKLEIQLVLPRPFSGASYGLVLLLPRMVGTEGAGRERYVAVTATGLHREGRGALTEQLRQVIRNDQHAGPADYGQTFGLALAPLPYMEMAAIGALVSDQVEVLVESVVMDLSYMRDAATEDSLPSLRDVVAKTASVEAFLPGGFREIWGTADGYSAAKDLVDAVRTVADPDTYGGVLVAA